MWLHHLGADPATDVCIFGAEFDKTTFFSASVSIDGHWLVVSASPGTAPRNDLWLADLTTSDPAAPVLTEVQVGVDAHTSLHMGRDGRAYIYTDRDAPRGRLVVTTPHDPSIATWRDLLPEDPEAVLEDFAILDGDELARPLLLASWTRHAVSELTLHDLETGERIGEVPLPGLGSIGGLVRASRRRHRLLVRLHRPHHAVECVPLRCDAAGRRDRGRPLPAPSTCPRCTPGWSTTPRATAPPCA